MLDFYLVSAVVILGGLLFWLVYCLVASLVHGPEKALHVIKATGQYFPLRGKLPRFKLPPWPRRKP